MVVSKMEASGDEVSNSEDAEDVLSVLATESRIDRNIIVNNINKVDPTGATLDTKQQHIVKFKTNSFEKNIYIHGPKKNERNVINAGALVNLNYLSHEEQSSCWPMQLIKSRIMIQSNLPMQICMGH